MQFSWWLLHLNTWKLIKGNKSIGLSIVFEHPKWGKTDTLTEYLYILTFLCEIRRGYSPHTASIYKYFFENNIFCCRCVCPLGLEKGPLETV